MKDLKLKGLTGFIMIHLILALSILGPALMFLGRWVMQYQRSVERSLFQIRRRLEYRSMAYQGMALIAQDEPGLDHLGESWNQNAPGDVFERQGVLLEISDEAGKLDLNRLVSDDPEVREKYEGFLTRLFEILKVSPLMKRKVFEYMKSHGPLKNIQQLPVIEEVMKEGDIDLSRYLTVYSRGQINVNTASGEVLEVLLEGADPFLLKEILKVRERHPFQEAGRIPGIRQDVSKFMTVKSSYFRIQIQENSERKSKLDVIIQREWGELKIRQWIEK